jgi:hypothetical protein
MRNVLMELTNAFKLKRICFTFFSAILFPLSLTPLYCDASSIKFSVRSAEKIAGHSSDLDMAFTAMKEEYMIKVNLQLNGKEIIVRKGYGNREKEFYVEGYSIDSGEIASLSTDDFNALEALLMEIETDYNDLEKTFIRTLNLLHNWPPNLSLFVLMDESIVFIVIYNFIPLIFPSSILDSPPLIVDICYDYGKPHDGKYFFFLAPLLHMPIIQSVTEIVGGEECVGRCGKGCIGDGPPNNKINIYTQACFNHDLCAENVGYIALECMIIFVPCFRDFLLGPDCNDAISTRTNATYPSESFYE